MRRFYEIARRATRPDVEQRLIEVDSVEGIEPAVAANPYLQFNAKVNESGTFKFSWTDDGGTVTTAEEKITVA